MGVGRPARFTSDQILDVAAQLIAAGGPNGASMATIASELGAPTGSIYHRFESRDLLMARLWIRTVKRAQIGFLDALAQPERRVAAIDAALHIPRWSRSHLDEAQVLLLYRRDDLAAQWPDELGEELAALNRPVQDAIGSFTRRLFGRKTSANVRTVAFALVDVPYAAVRRYLLGGQPPPAAVDDLVTQTCDCVLFSRVG
jgi:AcrR family transcriptional regulator